MADPVDAQLVQFVLTLFGPAFHVSRGYGPAHDGVDIGAAAGTPLHAIAAGTVSYARNDSQDHEDPKRHWALGGGNVVNIDIPGNRTLQYAHLQSFDVKEGDVVAAGQLIGKVGATGRATGPHVHFGLWDHKTNKMIRPHDYLATLPAGAPVVGPDDVPVVVPIVTAQIDDVERFDPPRRFRSRPGVLLRGFDPARPNQVIRQQTSAIPTGANAAAIVRISWPDMDPLRIPNGTYVEVANGLFTGLYIPAEDVDLDPAPV